MAGSFSIGALAVAQRDANAVGAVRLSLLPKRLEIELLSAARYREGFVPGALTRLSRVSVPYTAVRGFVRREGGVMLALDPRAVTPYNRFFLTHFTELPLEAMASAFRRGRRLRALAFVLPVPLAAALALAAPSDWASGPLGVGALFGLLALGLGTGAARAARSLSLGGPIASGLADVFEHRLAERVGLLPEVSHETDPFEVPELRPARSTLRDALSGAFEGGVQLPEPQAGGEQDLALGGMLGAPAPRSIAVERPLPAPLVDAIAARAPLAREPRARRLPWRMAFAALAAAVSLLAVVFGLRKIGELPRQTPLAAQAGLSEESLPASDRLLTSKYASCQCDRSDSPLWREGLPVLTVLPIGKGEQLDALGDISPKKRGRRSRYDFDLAVVNNGGKPLRDVRVLLTFARRDQNEQRAGVTDRGLFWEGELGSARSVKWGVRAPGTEVTIDIDEKQLLGAEHPPATADDFRRLLGARQALVRLHAAIMLAYLGDPGAKDALAQVGELPPADEQVRQQALRALAPLKVCELSASEGALRACFYNGSEASVVSPLVSEVSADGTAARQRVIDEAISSKSGVLVSFADFGGAPNEIRLSESQSP